MKNLAPLLAVPLLLLTACGGQDSADTEAAVKEAVAEALASQSAAPAPPSPSAPSQAPAAPAPAPPTDVAAAEPVQTVDFVMPDFRGANLQVAQDQIQELGVFFSVSHDLLGMRSQLLDSNWQVCDQVPAPGTPVSGPAADFEGTIDFGAVKLTESCP